MPSALEVNRKLQRNRKFKEVLFRRDEHARQDWVVQAEETASRPQRNFRNTKLSQLPDNWTSQSYPRRVARRWSGLLHSYVFVSDSEASNLVFRRVRKITKSDS
jgi:hypothetical protein